MEYLRRFLIEIRKQDNREDLNPNFKKRLGIAIAIGVIMGIIIDILLPFNFAFNLIRGVLVLASSVSLFSLLHLLNLKYNEKRTRKDRYYKPLRKRFSFNQRLNISILLGTLIVIFVLLNGYPSTFYSLKANLSIVGILFLFTFARRDRNEFLKSIYDLPDLRDLKFQKEKDKKLVE